MTDWHVIGALAIGVLALVVLVVGVTLETERFYNRQYTKAMKDREKAVLAREVAVAGRERIATESEHGLTATRLELRQRARDMHILTSARIRAIESDGEVTWPEMDDDHMKWMMIT
jgi:hypothetical protein